MRYPAEEVLHMRYSAEEVLTEVRDCGPVTVADIANGLGLSASTVRRVLKQLEKAGLVESSASYRRRGRVFLAVDDKLGSELPFAVGLCPDPAHTHEFYLPLSSTESETCPQCQHKLVVYVRKEGT